MMETLGASAVLLARWLCMNFVFEKENTTPTDKSIITMELNGGFPIFYLGDKLELYFDEEKWDDEPVDDSEEENSRHISDDTVQQNQIDNNIMAGMSMFG